MGSDLEFRVPPLRIQGLRKIYERKGRPPLKAVDGISFQIEAGECFGLLGPNGAGKSTSIKCVTGFYPPTEGKIEIDGVDVHQEPKRARRVLGVCSQEDTLDTDFNVLDQMLQFATFFSIPRADAMERATSLLRRFGLAEKAQEPVESLSGGMRRRLQVARGLINHPKILVLDEPTTGLDPEARRVLWDILVEERRRGLAVLLSTHYMDEAERLCDRVAILHRGKILTCAPPQDLIEKEMGTALVQEELRPGCQVQRPPNLEDVYLKMTGSYLSGESNG